jgi:CRISPR-associated protein Cmr6
MIPAVPAYLGDQFKTAPPGHRFSLYFPVWCPQSWEIEKKGKAGALKKILELPVASREQIAALRDRQQCLAVALLETGRLMLEAVTTAPLVTGMGMEHPLENGFAFLNPYGIPYLPGSSIKGVLRRAAEELRDAGSDWSDETVERLFGCEDSDDARRGALTFWDSIPEIKGNALAMDVMTPHYGEYYQGKSSPHDAGQPNPIVFMVIPPESRFSFQITADDGRLPEELQAGAWKILMETAAEHAFEWLGFGAKTSVGYGALERDRDAETKHERRHREAEKKRLEEKERQAHLAAMSPLERDIEEIGPIGALVKALGEGRWSGDDEYRAAEIIKDKMIKEKVWKEKSGKKRPEKDKLYQRTLLVMKSLAKQGHDRS